MLRKFTTTNEHICQVMHFPGLNPNLDMSRQPIAVSVCQLVLCGGNPETPNFDNSARRPFLWHSKGLDLQRWSQVVAVTTGLFLFFPHLQKCTCHKVLGRQEVVYVRLLTGQSGTVNLKHFEKYVTYGVYHVSWSVVLRARALMILKFPQAKIFTKPSDN